MASIAKDSTPLSVGVDFASDLWAMVDIDGIDAFDEHRPAGVERATIDAPADLTNTSKQGMKVVQRRAQNRESQRTFRDRKRRHIQGLEDQLETLHEKHQDLLQSYDKQAKHIARLKSQCAQLQAQINAMKSSPLVHQTNFTVFDNPWTSPEQPHTDTPLPPPAEPLPLNPNGNSISHDWDIFGSEKSPRGNVNVPHSTSPNIDGWEHPFASWNEDGQNIVNAPDLQPQSWLGRMPTGGLTET